MRSGPLRLKDGRDSNSYPWRETATVGREQARTLMPNGAVSHRSAEGSSQQKRAHTGLVAGLNAAEFTLPPLHRASQNTPLNTASTEAEKPRSHRAQRGAADDLAGTWTKGPVRLSTSWLLIRHGTPSTFLNRVNMRRQTRQITPLRSKSGGSRPRTPSLVQDGAGSSTIPRVTSCRAVT